MQGKAAAVADEKLKSGKPVTHVPCALQASVAANPHEQCVSGLPGLKINAHCATLAGISPASTTSNCRIPAKKQKSECALDCQHRHATTQRL
jgi:hypothetical protein